MPPARQTRSKATDMLTLFGAPGSGSAAIEMALAAAGLPFRHVRAATWEPDSALEELGLVNPLRQIPTLLQDDGSVLTESAAILIQLGLEHPESGLLPAEPAALAQAIRGLIYITANCYAAIGVIDHPERWCADIDASARERVRHGATDRLHACWVVFADQFAGEMTGRPGALAFLAAVVSRWSGTRAHLAIARPEFLATLQRLDAHPALAPVIGRHWPETR
jgi:GST-like protein